MRVLFLDTNVFLQCQELKQLQWSDVLEEDDILLLISHTVQEEIDRMKHDGNTRRSRRARSATAFFRQLLFAESSRMVIRNKTPRVEIDFAPALVLGKSSFPFLDTSRADDRIILEALAYQQQNHRHKVAILTHDTQPMLTAKRCGLDFIAVPDGWILPPEPDKRDKRILELEKRIRTIEQRQPEIQVAAHDESRNPLNAMTLSVHQYSELTSDHLKQLLSLVKSKCPISTEFESPDARKPSGYRTAADAMLAELVNPVKYRAPTSEEIRVYKEEEYPKWLEHVENYFKALPSRLERSSRYLTFWISILNAGNVPGENVVVEFETINEGLLWAPPDIEKRLLAFGLELPSPPKAPRGQWIKVKNAFDYLSEYRPKIPNFPSISPQLEPVGRDKHAFYGKPKSHSNNLRHVAFECEEFRHKVNAKVFRMTVFASTDLNSDECKVRCRVTGKNLPEPVTLYLPISVTYQLEDTFGIAAQLIQ